MSQTGNNKKRREGQGAESQVPNTKGDLKDFEGLNTNNPQKLSKIKSKT